MYIKRFIDLNPLIHQPKTKFLVSLKRLWSELRAMTLEGKVTLFLGLMIIGLILFACTAYAHRVDQSYKPVAAQWITIQETGHQHLIIQGNY